MVARIGRENRSPYSTGAIRAGSFFVNPLNGKSVPIQNQSLNSEFNEFNGFTEEGSEKRVRLKLQTMINGRSESLESHITSPRITELTALI